MHKELASVGLMLFYFALDQEYTSWFMKLMKTALRDPLDYHLGIRSKLVEKQFFEYSDRPRAVLECFLEATPEPNIVTSARQMLLRHLRELRCWDHPDWPKFEQWTKMLKEPGNDRESIIRIAKDMIYYVPQKEECVYDMAFSALTYCEYWDPSLLSRAVDLLGILNTLFSWKAHIYLYFFGFDSETLSPIKQKLVDLLHADQHVTAVIRTNLLHKLEAANGILEFQTKNPTPRMEEQTVHAAAFHTLRCFGTLYEEPIFQ